MFRRKVNREIKLVDTGETMNKVYDAMLSAGLTEKQIINAVTAMQNAHIYFREPRL